MEEAGARRGSLAKHGWLCKHTDCRYACNEYYNNAMRRTCKGCERVKAVAMSPPLALSTAPKEPTVSVRPARATAKGGKAGQGEAAQKVKPAASAASGDAQRAVAKTFSNVVAPRPDVALEAIPTTTTEQKLGLTALQDIFPEKLFHQPPRTMPGMGSVDEIVAKAQPLADAEALAAKQAEVAEVRNSCQCLSAANPLREQQLEGLRKLEAELQKLEKRAPGSRLMSERLKLARQEHVQAGARWQQDAAAGKDKAAARLQEFLQAMDETVSAIHARRKQVIDAHTTVCAEWDLFNLKRQEQADLVLRQFDSRIADMEKEADKSQGSGSDGALALCANLPAPPVSPTPSAEDALVKAQRDVAHANEALAKLQQQMAVALAGKAEAERKAAATAAALPAPELRQSFDCKIEDLPTMIPEPDPMQWTDYYHLWEALESLEAQEYAAGIQVPVSFAQLQAGIQVPRQLLGETIWKLAFTAEPSPDTIISAQVRGLLHRSLRKHQSKLLSDKVKQEAAAAAIKSKIDEVVTDYRAKRLRADA